MRRKKISIFVIMSSINGPVEYLHLITHLHVSSHSLVTDTGSIYPCIVVRAANGPKNLAGGIKHALFIDLFYPTATWLPEILSLLNR